MLPVEQLAKQIASEGFMPRILEIERKILEEGQKGCEGVPYSHYFLDGTYVRSMFVKKGQLIVGRLHKQDCITIVSQGSMKVLDPKGIKIVSAPFISFDKAGVKRIGYVLEDCTFINVFTTDCTDLDTIEDELGCLTVSDYAQFLLEKAE
jgi:hypothetical protein